MNSFARLLLFVISAVAQGDLGTRRYDFFRGRPREGFVPHPPVEIAEAVKTNRRTETHWFQQKLDNFGPSMKTWQQRYFVNSQYYSPGGPMFVMIGGESAIDIGWMDYGNWVKNARVYGAYLFQVEHRYYGESHPTDNVSTENLKWLSSEQALADLANFIPAMKQKYNLEDAKVIVFGGSYPGSLAAWFRLKYPHLSDGAIGSSAPVWAKANFFEYLEVVGKSLDYVSPGCTATVKNAFTMLAQRIQSGNVDSVTEKFNLCTPLDTTKNMDLASFYEAIIDIFEGAVQYNSMGDDPLEFSEQLCSDVFGVASSTLDSAIESTNTNYGSRNLKATNVVLPNGSVDPWHALGILEDKGPTEIAAYYIGGSHCYDMMDSDDYDSDALKQVREQITTYIGKFLQN